MGDFLTEVFRRGGWAAIIVAAFASIGTWGLAHFAASPGTQVSVLWGLVRYTKAPLQSAPNSLLSTPETMAAKAAIESPPPASSAPLGDAKMAPIKVTHGIASVNDEAIRHARSQDGLRTLRPLEEGRGVEETPVGTYYFAYAPGTSYDHKITGQVEKSQSLPSDDFEFRHLKDGVVLVAYAVENDANRLMALEGDKEFSLVVTGEPWQDFTSMVEIPVGRIQSASGRRISDKEGLRRILDLIVR